MISISGEDNTVNSEGRAVFSVGILGCAPSDVSGFGAYLKENVRVYDGSSDSFVKWQLFVGKYTQVPEGYEVTDAVIPLATFILDCPKGTAYIEYIRNNMLKGIAEYGWARAHVTCFYVQVAYGPDSEILTAKPKNKVTFWKTVK